MLLMSLHDEITYAAECLSKDTRYTQTEWHMPLVLLAQLANSIPPKDLTQILRSLNDKAQKGDTDGRSSN